MVAEADDRRPVILVMAARVAAVFRLAGADGLRRRGGAAHGPDGPWRRDPRRVRLARRVPHARDAPPTLGRSPTTGGCVRRHARGDPRARRVLAASATAILMRAGGLHGRRQRVEARPLPFDRLADQILDLIDIFRVVLGDDRQRDAGAAGAAGAADAMDIILAMGRHVEVEDMADVRNVEAARRDVRADEKCNVASS